MTAVSKLAAALALVGGASSLALAVPAVAKDKQAAAAAPAQAGLKLSKEVREPALAAQQAIAAKDFATAQTQLATAQAAAKTDDEKYVTAALAYDLTRSKLNAQEDANPNAPVDETSLAAPLDTLIANPSTPADMKGKYNFSRGAIAYNSKQYAQALQYFSAARAAGYTNDDMPLLIVKSKMESGDVAGGTADLDQAIQQMNAAGKKAPEDYYRYAIARTNAQHLTQQSFDWMMKYLKAYPTQRNWRDIIVTYGLQTQPIATLDKDQKIDLFRLMRATGSLADQTDYLEYADDVSDRGLPEEAQAVLQEGKANGKIPAGNSYAGQLLTKANVGVKSEGPLAPLDTRARAAANGRLALQTGDAYLGRNEYAKAADLYRVALQKGGVDADTVNTHLGIALARSGDKAGAQTAFAAVKGAPRSGIAQLWTVYTQSPTAA